MDQRPAIISIIVAMAENRVIGRGGGLPWHISADLKRFKKITSGHSIIMGRRTYESIGRPLPKRRSIVISRTESFAPAGVEVVTSLEEALLATSQENEVFIIGGARVYRDALPLADRLYVTHVHADVDGDVHFPDFDQSEWQTVEESTRHQDDATGLQYSFLIYKRASGVRLSS